MTVTCTVEFEGLDKDQARRALVAAGFSVARVAVKAPKSNVTTMDRSFRASATTDMPDGLTREEAKQYIAGYAKGAWARRAGLPQMQLTEDGEPDWAGLTEQMKAFEWARHPSCHQAGMKRLTEYRSHPARAAEQRPEEVRIIWQATA